MTATDLLGAGVAATVIEARDLRRTFKSRGGDVEAVAGVDLTVRAGEIFGFLGPNGAGKATTLRMLATLLLPSGGEATVAGYDLRRQPDKVRENIGYVGQRGGTDAQVSGRSELVLQGRLYGMAKAQARERAAELLAVLELEDAADRQAGTYSGGQRRRLDIGIGLMHRPRLLFSTSRPPASIPRAGPASGWRSGGWPGPAPRSS